MTAKDQVIEALGFARKALLGPDPVVGLRLVHVIGALEWAEQCVLGIQERRGPRKCAVCGTVFAPVRRQLYCSSVCGNRIRAARKRQRRGRDHA